MGMAMVDKGNAPDCFGSPIGRSGKWRIGHVGISYITVPYMRPKSYARTYDEKPRKCPVAQKEWIALRHEHCVSSLAVARMRALELANWLRSRSDLPKSTKEADRNNTFPVLWSASGKCHIVTPLCRSYNDDGACEVALHIDSPHNYHIVDRSLAIRFLLPRWNAVHHLGLVPQHPEQFSMKVGSADDQAQFILLRKAVLGQLETPHVAASVTAAAVHRPISWILDSGSGHDIVDRQHVMNERNKWQRLPNVVHLTTAGGKTAGGYSVAVRVEPLQENVEAMILEHSPDVLSLGRRCMEEGFAFNWSPYSL